MTASAPLPEPTYRDELALARYLYRELERRLAGRDQPHLLRRVPADVCHLGVLSPVEESQASNDSASATPTIGNEEAPAESRQERPGPRPSGETFRDFARRPPSAMGLQFLLDSGTNTEIGLQVRVRFAVYSRHFPSYIEQRAELGHAGDEEASTGRTGQRHIRMVDVYLRREVAPATVTLMLDPSKSHVSISDDNVVQAALQQVLATAMQDRERPIWRPQERATVPESQLSSSSAYYAFLSQFQDPPPSMRLRAEVEVRSRRLENGLQRIQVFLRNVTPFDRAHATYNLLVDARMEVEVDAGQLVPIELVPVAEDYQYDREVWAVGLACSADVAKDRRSIRTRTLAQFSQGRATTQDTPPALLSDLATDPIGRLAEIYEAMIRYRDDWRTELEHWSAIGPGTEDLAAWTQEQAARQADLAAFDDEIDQFACGIAALRADVRLETAFRAMNSAFGRVGRRRYDRWRLFQIVYIVSQLPALAVREDVTEGEWPVGTKRSWPDVLDRVDVLWFRTGGGKTEAYLGLISCAILYDRLRGKFGGMTAWLRFPLRLLSVQQLQRAVVAIWETEAERRRLSSEAGRELGDPVAMGYLVGGEMTPNGLWPEGDGWTLANIEADPKRRSRLRLVRNCPACHAKGAIDVRTDRDHMRIRLVCRECGEVMPIYVSDDEIIRFLPSLVVGTVDKIAAVAYNAKLATLWSGPAWRCPHHPDHGYGTGRWCSVFGCPSNPKSGARPKRRPAVRIKDPSPALHVQDELHLLQQELGAFAGHYETMLRVEERVNSGKPSKVIAATATIEGFESQARHIYGAPRARRFPGRDRSLSNTFYARPDTTPDGAEKIGRVYLAFQPPRLSTADAASLCTKTFHEVISGLHIDPIAAAAAVGLEDAHSVEEIEALLSFYSTTVTYVGTKHNGTRISEALERSRSGKPGGAAEDLHVRFVSGETPFGEIADTVEDLESPPPWEEPGHLDSLVATSVISHGVDVERINLLVMESVPGSVADYIQASSRSGRRHVGLIVTVLPRHSLRATSIYHRFVEFHRHLDRMIGAVPINRFAKEALKRTFPGVMLGSWFSRHIASSEDDVDSVWALSGPLAAAATAQQARVAAEEVYGLGRGVYPPSLEEQTRRQIADRAPLFAAALARARRTGVKKLREAFDPNPMTSLRDVDTAIRFDVGDDVDAEELRWFLRPS